MSKHTDWEVSFDDIKIYPCFCIQIIFSYGSKITHKRKSNLFNKWYSGKLICRLMAEICSLNESYHKLRCSQDSIFKWRATVNWWPLRKDHFSSEVWPLVVSPYIIYTYEHMDTYAICIYPYAIHMSIWIKSNWLSELINYKGWTPNLLRRRSEKT